MNLVELIVNKHPSIQNVYKKEYEYWLKSYQEDGKEPLKEHEWWKEYIEEEEIIKDIPLATKYRILGDIILDLIKYFDLNREELKNIFFNIEIIIKDANHEELKEVEILFLEGIQSCLENDEKSYQNFRQLLGPKTSELCDQNNAFWGTPHSRKKD